MPWKVAWPSRISTRPRTAGRATEPRRVKIGVAGKAGDGGAHLKFGRSLNVDIELDVIEWRVGDRDSRELAAALEISAEIESRSHRNLGDADFAGDGGCRAGPDPMQFRIGRGTDARRITQANILAGGGEIEIELLVEVGGVAPEVKRAASGMGGKGLDVDIVASEQKRAVELGETAGQSGIGKRTAGD